MGREWLIVSDSSDNHIMTLYINYVCEIEMYIIF